MTLTPEDLKALQKPFARKDHSFLPKGNDKFAYIDEEAIGPRLDEVDPAWAFEILTIGQNREKQLYVSARLTVKGVSRCNVGMQDVQSVGEPEKGATTDALKRCARLFGIGRYLLSAPKTSGAEFDKWLAEQQKAWGVTPQETPAAAQNGATTPPQGGDGHNTSRVVNTPLNDRGPRRVTTEEPAKAQVDKAGFTAYSVVKMDVYPRGDSGHQYILRTPGGVNIVSYSAEAFRAAGFGDAVIDQWKQDRAATFDPPLKVWAKLVPNAKSEGMGWDVKRIDQERITDIAQI